MTSTTHLFKNAMRVYAAELICSTGVLGFQTFLKRNLLYMQNTGLKTRLLHV